MRDVVETEFVWSREIIKLGFELVPRFRIGTAYGEAILFVQSCDDLAENLRRMSLISSFMRVNMAQWFVLSSELAQPDALSAIAVGRNGGEAAWQHITRSPLSFGETNWLKGSNDILCDIEYLLPRRVESVTYEQVAEVDALIARNDALWIDRL